MIMYFNWFMIGNCEEYMNDVEQQVIDDINLFVCDLFDLASERGKCSIDEYGASYLSGIPLKLLCDTVIAFLNVQSMKILIRKGNGQNIYSENEKKIVDERIRAEIKKILFCHFLRYDERKDTGENNVEYVQIIGHMERNINRRISYFFALVVYKFVFEKDLLNQSQEEFWSRKIIIPYEVNLQRFFVRRVGKVKRKYSKEYIVQWKQEMCLFLKKESAEGGRYGYFEDIVIDEIANGMQYIVET